MDPTENSGGGTSSRPMYSSLKPPSKISYAGKGLSEMSASANNSRSMMPPPEPVSLKHKVSSLPEPTPKRKTLAERAGEGQRMNPPAHGSARPLGSTVKATSLAGARTPSASSSASSRNLSNSTRTNSGSSFSGSVGYGSRPSSAQMKFRPQTAMDHTRSNGAMPQTLVPASRPASSLDEHSEVAGQAALGKRKAWDTKGRLEDMEHLYSELRGKMDGSIKERDGLEESVEVYKARINELEMARAHLNANTTTLQTDLNSTKQQLNSITGTLDDERRRSKLDFEDLTRQNRNELDSVQRRARDEADDALRAHREEVRELELRLKNELEEEKRSHVREVQEATTQSALSRQNADLEIDKKDRDMRRTQEELDDVKGQLVQERALTKNLRDNVSESSSTIMTLESTLRSVKSRVEFLESDSKSQAQSFVAMDQKLQDAIDRANEADEKLRQEESLRRKLHNQVQELKGNIRVFCRVRPLLEEDVEADQAKINFPDSGDESKELEVMGPEEKSSLGNISSKKNAFAFDHVFRPLSQNQEVFDEISQLVQSALDGYNVCIFCYGQTGSGKTFTMSADDGMIPRAVHQIYETAQSLEPKGWKYTMEGSFLEVYNENLNDLLGRPEEFDKKKHEIRHDTQRCKTTVSDLTTVTLDSPSKVESILRRATSNRSVAATKANERSSRSHSVFILRLIGENHLTGERSEGTLNLVDLAGSERLSQSGATGERLKETQNINKSLSCLGDVIGALGQGREGGHVPYRNSKLTYLLQYSLGGNSKTLMFVMISPLQGHLSETLTSLKFATKVHNTHIGTARRQAKIRDS